MKTRPLDGALPGERLIGVDPGPAPLVTPGWRSRLNLFTGRTLTEPALTRAQAAREGHLAVHGRRTTPGVLAGLELALGSGASAGDLFLEPGYAIAASGEDIVVPVAKRYAIDALPVYAPVRLLQPIEGGEAPAPDAETPGGLYARRLSHLTLGEIHAALGEAPETRAFHAGIIVAEPVSFNRRVELQTVCADDESGRAFEDEVRADACRLLFYAWPTEGLPLPAEGSAWRNRLAYAVFQREMALPAGEMLPWAGTGVPLGLLALDAGGVPLFIDRAAVVRAGGRPRVRGLRPGAGTRLLWQARMEQLSEHLVDPALSVLEIEAQTAEFRYLPPAGLLPRAALDALERTGRFFPPAYRQSAVPVPLEQLDIALEASAGLAPFDLATPDDVELLVPVPQAWYEPRLLHTDEIDPVFEQSIERFVELRGKWLLRRGDVRDKADAVERAIRGRSLTWPEPDPGSLDADEALAEVPQDDWDAALADAESEFGTFVSDAGDRRVKLLEDLREQLAATPIQHTATEPLDALPAGVTLPADVPISHAGGRLTFRGQMTETQRQTLLRLSNVAAYQAAVSRLFERSQRDDLSQLDVLGVEGFIEHLDAKVRRADDTLDLGFLNVQTGIYRVRQLLLGTEAATRLATSPALASIAQGASATATREDLTRFFQAVRGGVSPLMASTGDTSTAAPGAAATSRAADAPGDQPFSGLNRLNTATFTSGMNLTPNLGRIPGLEVASTGRTGLFDTDLGLAERGIAGRLEPGGVELSGGRQPLFRPDREKEIAGQAPIAGETYDFRTVTIAERLAAPPAFEAKGYSVGTKYEVVSGIAALDIAIDDLSVPGFKNPNGGDVFLGIGDIIRDNRILELLSPNKPHDPDPPDGDEAAFLSSGVRALENSVSTLRVVEGRVQQYRNALNLCRTALAALQRLAYQAAQRLDALEDGLAEARHDVAVARSLQAEEKQRIEAINARRAAILAQHVDFIAYRRPRTTSARMAAPSRRLNPGLTLPPVPACIAENLTPPPDLSTMLDVFKDAPAAWLRYAMLAVQELRRPADLRLTLADAKVRAQVLQAVPQKAIQATQGIQAAALTRVISAQSQALQPFKLSRTTLDLSFLATDSWSRTAEQAKAVLNLGDLISNSNPAVAQHAARELYDIGQVGTCLYRSMAEVPAALRLEWAVRLSQFDTPIALRMLTALPRWEAVDFARRRDTQALVDWLYSRVDLGQPSAVALMDDYVRVCILLASHAPISQIVGGRLARPAVVRPGERIEIAVLPRFIQQVEIGMQAVVYAGADVAAVAVVRDISGGQVQAEVMKTQAPSVHLAQDTGVQFVLAGSSLAGLFSSRAGLPR